MLAIKEAVNTAIESFKELYDPSKYKDVSLEEIEMSEDDRYWLITLGYSELLPDLEPSGSLAEVSKAISIATKSPLSLGLGLDTRFNRKFRVFKIDAKTGALRSMKDWAP